MEESKLSIKAALRILETTDLHVHMMNYDYYGDRPVSEYGFAQTASLIRQARAEKKNVLLFDNGDLLQGNPMGDYMASGGLAEQAEVHPVYRAMNELGYDAATLGNHEFNYGLEYLDRVLAGASFPYTNANLYLDGADVPANAHYLPPYLLLERTVEDEEGHVHPIKIGVIGLVTPQIMNWDKANLEGRLKAEDMVETAKAFVPKLKEEGADLIVLLAHCGYEDIPEAPMTENAVLHLSRIPGVDAILFGHAHKVFPGAAFEGKTGVDLKRGTVNGVPAVEAGYAGDHLGVVDLDLELGSGGWKVTGGQAEARPVYNAAQAAALVRTDDAVAEAVREAHEGTLAYIRAAVGETTEPIDSFFALVRDSASVQIVNDAQRWYLKKEMQGTPYENLPVLAAGAPFKTGGRYGPSYYTSIPAGPLAVKHIADLYNYPNTLCAVLLNGAELREWLEWAAGLFRTIDPQGGSGQSLIDPDFPSFNFDIVDGVSYTIDVSRPAKYSAACELLHPDSRRIGDLRYEGRPVEDGEKFVIATNNYRAFSTPIANPDGRRVVLEAPDENRQILTDYIRSSGVLAPKADGNWKLTGVPAGLTAELLSSPEARGAGLPAGIEFAGMTEDGFARFTIEVSALNHG
ncbi:bifunctional 2',3'-cyclic-nucleotide 2'-phosphodiesterase/3'-nucleotidase [Saccharibacillus alkalitolerans]|uniref:Bifunctional 2',3'-cyclic-nucleotide 2'-phosphodiesterase/3'-nucleotidase n=1 Tax=Saccharibacillus alkalitolerans TaxID=2705290 RepID=A0ABX0F673_9BACL|nr:bifunctional 2',3'-cyclic-nucleotide 2'-phosphodiesterase/3'-nucleotidase [Saccharibacillus alkalitolerans]NGZ75950.1 bifunctional 2',3'-cyclic-nucleotide 2'-phosphodiesterase/3'-nucleotidase [Saccharibacillus alkalitolerans]